MQTHRRGMIFLGIVTLVVILIVSGAGRKQDAPEKKLIATVSYYCDAYKSVTADFYEGPAKPSSGPDMPPVPGGSVHLSFSDGRMATTLPQTLSADGMRYANDDESFLFWGKGNTALVLEHNEEKTYKGCIAAAPEPAGEDLSYVYARSEDGFSIRLPNKYRINESYAYQGLGRGKEIPGTKFMIPPTMATSTNLSTDTYLSVEHLTTTGACTADKFLSRAAAENVEERGVTYSVAQASSAAAGNRYEEKVYAFPDTNPCIAVRYFIHYGAIENYEPDKVTEFDKQALLKQFDAVRRTLVIVQ